MALVGKGFYVWRIKNCEKGDPNAIASLARAADLSHLLVKVADNVSLYNYDWEKKVDLVPPLVYALRVQGIQAWGWQYIYGLDPIGEARTAANRVRSLGLDGFVVNAEKEFKAPGMATPARRYMAELRRNLPDTPLALSTYRFPSLHPQFPYEDFLNDCDFSMPQVYWMGNDNPDVQLTKSFREYQEFRSVRPMIPTGFAFKEFGYFPKPAEVTEFLLTAKSLNMTAANFWSWDSCRANLPDIWQTISDFDWANPAEPPDPIELYFDALNSGDPVNLALLYSPQAVHVTPARTVQGTEGLIGWYNQLFTEILPGATFTLKEVTTAGNSHHITWEANSPSAWVSDGSDTLAYLNGKIAYHYTSFTLLTKSPATPRRIPA